MKRAAPYGWAVALVAATTGVAALGRSVFALADTVMLYLVAITIVAARFERAPSLVAALLSVACYDFFFIPPYYTFQVADLHHTLTFAMMFGASILVSGLTQRIRRQEEEVRKRDEHNAALALRARTEEMRASLLSAVSHDLRTPLAVITGAATTLRDDAESVREPARTELVSTICEEAERLERLVGNLLHMTRIEAGGAAIKREWVPVEELVVSAMARLEGPLAARRVATKLPESLPLVSVDPVLFEQVFLNLLENAVKYTPSTAAIEIEGRRADDRVVIDVMDQGPGFSPGDEDRIFEKFYRGTAARSGVGLGLAICRGIVEAHGGTITAKNREGGGGAFRITIPVGAPPQLPVERDDPVRVHGRTS